MAGCFIPCYIFDQIPIIYLLTSMMMNGDRVFIIHHYEEENAKISISLTPCCIRFTYNEEVYVFDLEARPIFMYFDNYLYERGLSGEIVVKKWLSFRPLKRYLERISDWIVKEEILRHTFDRVRWIMDVTGLDNREYREILDKIYRGDIVGLKREEEIFKRLYRPISILPPDQYLSLVFQPLEGCPYNKCSFCTFYRDREFRFKDIDEFEAHVRDVLRFLGRGVYMRRKVFLADANAMYAPTDLLLEYINILRRNIDPSFIEGIYSFSDYFTVHKDIGELMMLRESGVKRVYIGLESGSEDVLKLLAKPGPVERAINFVNLLKKVGISVGVIVLIGAGGREYFDDHVKKTIEALNSMKLDSGDIIYYSKLKIHPESRYAYLMEEYGITELNDEWMDRQIEYIRRGLTHRSKPINAIYDIDETIY